ncbi:PAS domain S-box protein, partial [bacterium]|nr:PAS domain S-box protein [bacterium]
HLGDDQHMQVEFRVADDGTLHCFDLRISSVTAPGRACAGTVLLLCDITAQRRAEDALEEQLISYEDLVDSVREAVLVQDADGILISASRGVEEVFGFPRDELLGRSLSDLIPQNPDENVALTDRLHCALEGEPQRFEARGRRSDGESFPAAVRLYRTSQRGEAAVVALISDTSEHQRAEESQRLAIAGQLAAGVAHEFNNLLAALLMRAELAARSSHEETRVLAAVVKRSAQRGAEVCGNLLAFARPRPPRPTPLRVETPLESALQVARHQLMASGAQVVRDFQTGSQQVLADDGQLEQVFLNLILNACHALASDSVPPERRQLRVSTRLDQGPDGSKEVVVSVTDTGVGMSPQSLRRAFEPFFTTRASTDKDMPKGSGLGLSVSHGIIAAHDGHIELQSQLGEGTTVEVRLPAVASAPGPPSEPVEEETIPLSACAPGVGRVLVAEDEEEVRSLISEVISLSGCQTMEVATTSEAISALGQHRFSAVVSDLMMPGGGGEEILRYSQTLDCPPPVIIVTGKIEAGLANQVMSLGARRLLSKPFSLRELRSAVLELVGN